MPAIASSSSDWPLPATPATPTISPRRTARLTPLTRSHAEPVLDHRSLTSSTVSPGRRRRLVHAQDHRAADHQLGELLGARVSAVGSVATTWPWRITVTASVTSRISRSLWVMRTTVLPSAAERAEDAEQVVGLLGRQHGGGLVEDQHVGAPVERLEDLHALALAHAEILHARVGVDLQVVLAPEALERGPGAGQARLPAAKPPSTPSTTFSSTVNGSTSMKCWCTMPMPAASASWGLRDRCRAAAHEDLARVRPVVAVEDAHQRGLAGAVLADDAVDGARAHGQRDAAVGVDVAEPLVDARSSMTGRAGHAAVVDPRGSELLSGPPCSP